MRYSVIPVLFLAMIFLGAGCGPRTGIDISSRTPAADAPMENLPNPRELRSAEEALALYKKVQDSFAQDTPTLYLALVQFHDERKARTEILEEWADDYWKNYEKKYRLPDIAGHAPIAFAQEGDKAAYHYSLPDEDVKNKEEYGMRRIYSLPFIRVQGSWKLMEEIEDILIEFPSDAAGQQRTLKEFVDNYFLYNEDVWGIYTYRDESHVTRVLFGDIDLAQASGTRMTLPYRSSYPLTIQAKGVRQIAGQVNIDAMGFGRGVGFNAPITETPEQTFKTDIDFPEDIRGTELTIRIRLTGESSYDVLEDWTTTFSLE